MTRHRFTTCIKCSSPLALQTWCEPADDDGVRILWRCPACASEFETVERCTDEKVGELKEAMDVFWPTLLVA
jgi:hypothetical protein